MDEWDDVARHFSSDAVAHLATLQADGSPRVTPVWADVDGERIVFFAERTSLNARNVDRDPRVALSMTHPQQPLDMASVRGEVVERIEGERALEIVDRIARKYTGEDYDHRMDNVVFVVKPRRWSARDYSG
jgi:PPOX class probable F420-dependent enzyme